MIQWNSELTMATLTINENASIKNNIHNSSNNSNVYQHTITQIHVAMMPKMTTRSETTSQE